MCAIVGFQGNIDTYRFEKALALLKHRGPDDAGVFFDSSEKVGLGHQRLAIQDVSSLGHQPMLSADGNVVIIFNGEIYNFCELRAGLEKKGVIFNGDSDTEVLLHLYLSDGEAMLSKLNGIFAFAIWDAKYQKLLIVRDALGVKPLYYSTENDRFIFASEIKALMPLMQYNDSSLSLKSIERYITFLWCPGNTTPLKSVYKLLPGEAMVIKKGKINRKWLWHNLPTRYKTTNTLNKTKAISATTHHFRQAVHRQMIADVPVGAFLSGGLDSSAVVAFAREINPEIPCFTIKTNGAKDEGMVDDLPYAKKVAKHLSVPLNVVSIDSNTMASGLENMVAILDEPLADPAPLNVLFISQLARENGIKVLLSGAGGDDIFTGYRRHRAIQLDRYLQLIPSSLRSSIKRYTSSLNSSNSFHRRLAKLFNGSNLDGDERIINYFHWIDEKTVQSLFTPEACRELKSADVSEPMLEFLKYLPKDITPLERMLLLEQRFFLADHNLIYTDKMSMATGVEVRVPFLDNDLVEFAAQIPIKYKQRGNVGKWVLKKAMEPYLPYDTIYRPKTGFGAPLRHWMRFELRELLGDLLSESSIKKRGIFNPHAVQRLIKNNDLGVVDASYILLSLMCIEIWCRQFLDGQFNYQEVYASVT